MEMKQSEIPNYFSADEFNNYTKNIFDNANKDGDKFALVSIDCDNFNFINDLFSYEVGDAVLQCITEHFSTCLMEGECFSRLHADHFVFLVNETQTLNIIERLHKITNTRNVLSSVLPTHYNVVFSGGVVSINEDGKNFAVWLDKATFARKQAKGNHVNTFLLYDKNMDENLHWKKTITLIMESALHENEFEMYLQPKVLLKTSEVVGAEALVRWNSKKHGMIYPDKFIPILEQNGFIKQLDFFMLEQACLFLKRCIDNGEVPLPISVNFSKMHLRSTGFVEKVFYIVNRQAVPTRLIEIEVNENIYLGDFQILIEVASAFKQLGFKVSLDDFGSAYSSLNYLKDLPLDIIKIDKGFLNATENTDKGSVIIAKMIELIKSLRLTPVMEGVETAEQVDFLQKLSCDLGQGYYFAKPMPVKDYTEFIQNNAVIENIEQYLQEQQPCVEKSYKNIIPQEFQMDNWELYTLGKNIDMGLMKGYLDGDATVQYVNDRALEYLGYSRQEFREIFHNSIVAFTHPDDVHIVQANAKQLVETGVPLQFKTRATRKDGKTIVLQGRSSCVIDSQGRPIGLYAFQDVTEELERIETINADVERRISGLEKALAEVELNASEMLRLSEEKCQTIVEQTNNIVFDWDFDTDTIVFSGKYVELFGDTSVQENVSVKPVILERIIPEDRERFISWAKAARSTEGKTQAEYRIKTVSDEYICMKCQSKTLKDSKGNLVKAVGVISDIE